MGQLTGEEVEKEGIEEMYIKRNSFFCLHPWIELLE